MRGRLHLYPRPDARYSLVRGPLHLLIEGTPIRCHRARGGGLETRTDRLPDIMAMAELAGWHVVVHDEGAVPR